jgi:plastocyanin
MNRLGILAVCLIFGVLSLMTFGCPYVGPQYPTIYGNLTVTPTPPTATAVTLTGNSAANYAFNPSPVTIVSNGSITFIDQTNYGSPHVIWVDNGSGVCLGASSAVTVPTGGSTVVAGGPYANAGTYHYHCIYHSFCGMTTCNATCTGMAGVIYIP